MHELALVEAMIHAVTEEVDRAGVTGPVRDIYLGMGPLACAGPDAIRETFALLASGTRAAGATLHIKRSALNFTCGDCGASGALAEPFDPCPRCGGAVLHLDGAREIQLLSIDVETD